MKKAIITTIISIVIISIALLIMPFTLSADMEWKSATENIMVSMFGNTSHYWTNSTGDNVNFVVVTLPGISNGVAIAGEVGLVSATAGTVGFPNSHLFSQDGQWVEVVNTPFGDITIYMPIFVSGIGTPNITTTFNFGSPITIGTEVTLNNANGSYMPVTIEYRWGQSTRTGELVCYKVWINEDGHFQFIFWYPYADNNWVRIYDMEGNMVFEADMPYDNPNLIVDLPDGMYLVKTFHDQPDPIQEFYIGKPAGDM